MTIMAIIISDLLLPMAQFASDVSGYRMLRCKNKITRTYLILIDSLTNK
jgi:hypothetical protein